MTADDDRRFAGGIPQIYEQYLVPLIFRPYAEDLAIRAQGLRPRRVLEIAAGTGVLTRSLSARLPRGAEIVATDLNVAMLQQAQRSDTSGTVQWRQADAMQLPFAPAISIACYASSARCSFRTAPVLSRKCTGCSRLAARFCSTCGIRWRAMPSRIA